MINIYEQWWDIERVFNELLMINISNDIIIIDR
jgi:hypothetical protein